MDMIGRADSDPKYDPAIIRNSRPKVGYMHLQRADYEENSNSIIQPSAEL